MQGRSNAQGAAVRATHFKKVLRTMACMAVVLLFGSSVAIAAPKSNTSKKYIRSIVVEVDNIFEDAEPGGLFDTVNSLKSPTREYVIRRELMFTEGDEYNEFWLSESERNLRALPFIRQITITPLPDGNAVDIIVSVQDTWTVFPQFSFSSGGGTDKTAVGIAEGNLFGTGKRVEFNYADDEGRETIGAVWDDRRLLGTRQRLVFGAFHRSDGYRSVVSWGRPFRSLVEDSSWLTYTDVFNLVGRLFEAGDERFIYRQKHQEVRIGYTVVSGDPKTLRGRFTFGYGYASDSFEMPRDSDFENANVDPDSVSRDPELLPENRRFSGPFISYEQIKQDFLSINYVDRFERVEDFNLGRVTAFKLGLAMDALGSHENTIIGLLSERRGARISPTAFVRGETSLFTRANEDGLENTIGSGEIKYINVLGAQYLGGVYVGKHTFLANLDIDLSNKLDLDREYLLGADTGLRGYKDRTFTGGKRAVLNVEHRAHFVENVFKLVNIGAAAFFDVGGTTNAGFGRILSENLYADVGAGLRLGFPRSGGGKVLRVDVAFPLRDGPDDSKKWEPRFLIEIGQVFSTLTDGEQQAPQHSRLSVTVE